MTQAWALWCAIFNPLGGLVVVLRVVLGYLHDLDDALRDPAGTARLDPAGWTALLTIARVEQLLGTLARRLSGLPVPDAVADILAEARVNAEYQRRSALWEADCARRALADYSGKVVLMKGTAYVAAGLKAGEGRHIGDLDIIVAQADLPQVEAALLKAGWEWVKEDAYDDAYYRTHMHELPPLIHLPLTSYIEQQGVHGVWVFDDASSIVTFRPVRLIGFDGNEALVGEGLKPTSGLKSSHTVRESRGKTDCFPSFGDCLVARADNIGVFASL